MLEFLKIVGTVFAIIICGLSLVWGLWILGVLILSISKLLLLAYIVLLISIFFGLIVVTDSDDGG